MLGDAFHWQFYIPAIGLLMALQIAREYTDFDLWEFLGRRNAVLRWSVYYACAAMLVFYGRADQAKQFIYFQF